MTVPFRRILLTLATLTLGAGAAHAGTVTVPADGIYAARDAANVCLDAEASARWNGQWVTTEWARMSVCGCTVETADARATFDVEAGPLWNNAHAQQVCPQVCGAPRWTGGYTFVDAYAASTCSLDYPGRIRGAVKVLNLAPRVAPVRVVVAPRPRLARHSLFRRHATHHARWRGVKAQPRPRRR
ncbi:MAG: hypothetical protein EP329_11370 [Deltaproteobacteria bacterium]|nr:MAG: hypothetical protein EP329_11370 [Deltaproteobacteria bacterium]